MSAYVTAHALPFHHVASLLWIFLLDSVGQCTASSECSLSDCLSNVGIRGTEIKYFQLFPMGQPIFSMEQKGRRPIPVFNQKTSHKKNCLLYQMQYILPYRSYFIIIATYWVPPMEHVLCKELCVHYLISFPTNPANRNYISLYIFNEEPEAQKRYVICLKVQSW